MNTVIMAGGKGTRMASVMPDMPKPMIPLCGKPILEHQLECLKKNKITDVIIIIGHLGEQIRTYFGDGSEFGCNISYYEETHPLGTAGGLYKIIDKLADDFIVLNGDLIFDMDFGRLVNFHHRKQAAATLVAHPNNHPFDSALLVTDGNDRVVNWINKEDPRQYYRNQVNAGIHVLSRAFLKDARPEQEKIDIDRDILKPQISSRGIYAYRTPEYIKDMGTPERFKETERDIEEGLVERRNLSRPQRAVFLDRDGTINVPRGFISKPEDLELIPGVAEAVRSLNATGWLVIVITNQSVIARGEASLEDLRRIHDKMETDLGKVGAFVDDIFFCPHHPDRGFPGERPEYKIECRCRKPKPGLLLQAAKTYNIDLSQSYMVGDELKDVEAAVAAGCQPILLVNTSSIGKDYLKRTASTNMIEPIFQLSSLLQHVDHFPLSPA
jgi:D,D-heptose 1,7-bisphosphate phosphatase